MEFFARYIENKTKKQYLYKERRIRCVITYGLIFEI